jgi:N-acetylglucosaminyl-diphospho-decaprenol L-rhamnosyltransferase
MWRLAVVIVTHDSGDEIGACLDALTRATAALAPDIVVIDNGSTDATADVVASRGIRVLPGPNVGFAAGCNRGFAATTGEFVLLLNPDTEVTPDGVTRLVAALDARPDAAVAGPRIVDARGHAELSFDAMLSPLVEARRKLVQAALDHGFGLARAWAARHTRRPRDVDWVSGACLLVRRADAEAVGGLDERIQLVDHYIL